MDEHRRRHLLGLTPLGAWATPPAAFAFEEQKVHRDHGRFAPADGGPPDDRPVTNLKTYGGHGLLDAPEGRIVVTIQSGELPDSAGSPVPHTRWAASDGRVGPWNPRNLVATRSQADEMMRAGGYAPRGDDDHGWGQVGKLHGIPDQAAMLALLGFGKDARVAGLDATAKGYVEVEVASPSLETCGRTLLFDAQGRRGILNNDLVLTEEAQNKGAGTRIFARQVAAATAAGFAYIETHAAGCPGDTHYNGYYTWPCLGYDQDIASLERENPALCRRVRRVFPDAKAVQDVLATPDARLPAADARIARERCEQVDAKLNRPPKDRTVLTGKDWWQAHGDSLRQARFDLTPGSRSHQILDAYVAGRREKARLYLAGRPADAGGEA